MRAGHRSNCKTFAIFECDSHARRTVLTQPKEFYPPRGLFDFRIGAVLFRAAGFTAEELALMEIEERGRAIWIGTFR